MTIYHEHSAKTSRWRDGDFEVLPDAEAADCTVWVCFEQADSSGGEERWEGLLAKKLAENRAVVCAVPAFTYNLNLGDEVEVIESAEGALVATAPSQDSENVTFRVSFNEPSSGADSEWVKLMRNPAFVDCWFDTMSPTYLALSCPSQHAETVATELAARETAGAFIYETGSDSPPA